MKRDEILVMEPGRELDALVAEYVLGWRKMPGPKTDYDGPCESYDVLVPLTIDDPFPYYPPKGEIKPWYLCHKWSTDMLWAWKIVEKMGLPFAIFRAYENQFKVGELGWNVNWCKKYNCDLSERCEHGNDIWLLSAPLAICKAALLAKLEESASF